MMGATQEYLKLRREAVWPQDEGPHQASPAPGLVLETQPAARLATPAIAIDFPPAIAVEKPKDAAVESTACPFCGATAALHFIKRNGTGSYAVFRCATCLGAFIWPRPAAHRSLEIYQDPEYRNISIYEADELDHGYLPNAHQDARRMISACLSLTWGSMFFDIGAGYGVFSEVAQQAGFRVVACDPSPNARAIFSQRMGFAPEPEALDDELAARFESSFDVALLSQVLEHIPDPEAMVRRVRSILTKGGIVAVAVPHFGSALSRIQKDHDMFISPPEHLNFFSREALVRLFLRNGFHLERLSTVSKVPRPFVAKIMRNAALTEVGWRAGYAAMRLLDALGLGMVLNAYFRKA